MTNKGKDVGSKTGLSMHDDAGQQHTNTVSHSKIQDAAKSQYYFTGLDNIRKGSLKTYDQENELELELHKILSQDNTTDASGMSTGVDGLGNVTAESFCHRDEIAEAIEKAMAEIACPELWNHDHSSQDAAAGNEMHLSQLTMDGILENDETFVTMHKTASAVASAEAARHYSPFKSDKHGIHPETSSATFQTNTPAASESIDNSPSDGMTPTCKRKNVSAAGTAQLSSKKAKLLYETISPESLSPLSDNSDFLKSTYSKTPSSTQEASHTTGSTTESALCTDIKRKLQNPGISAHGIMNPSGQKSKVSWQQDSSAHIIPPKLTNEYTMQQVTETKRRIINTHKLILNFNFLKDSYTRSCSQLKKAIFKLKTSECHRARLIKENEQLKRLALDLHNRLEELSKNNN
ncbi:HBR131Cp [Eremothecium sinecaudum]|uniref:HBR131Cp n=1 Tax=Eremothecium sinecaudum TaxID=45286 RepID=A0A109UXB7_9SACH|nr:HBR131Cp [Eremothecium sinecaudum]AMD19032.1 HBR131Cp [Eremothecium sinecaudum]